MSREESNTYQINKAGVEQRDLFITKIKSLNNRISNNKFKLNLLFSILSSLMIIILISISSDIAYHKKTFSLKNIYRNNKNEPGSESDLYNYIGFSLLNFHINYNNTNFEEKFSFCRMGDCKQKSYENFNLTNYDINGKELEKNICLIFDYFKVSGYVVNKIK
jgi:hypothetical protein